MSRRSSATAAARSLSASKTRSASRSTTRGRSISIHECRPIWKGAPGEWTKTSVAQLRYEGDGTWTLYFGDRNSKWFLYFDLDSHQPVDVILEEIETDPTGDLLGLNHTWMNASDQRAYHHVRPRNASPPLGGTSSSDASDRLRSNQEAAELRGPSRTSSPACGIDSRVLGHIVRHETAEIRASRPY